MREQPFPRLALLAAVEQFDQQGKGDTVHLETLRGSVKQKPLVMPRRTWTAVRRLAKANHYEVPADCRQLHANEANHLAQALRAGQRAGDSTVPTDVLKDVLALLMGG